MSLNGILNTAVSGLQVNQAALRATSGNIANLNTEGYNRRVVELSPRLTGSQLSGVQIDEIRRIANEFLAREANAANGLSAEATALAQYLERAQGIMGGLAGGNSLTDRISALVASLQQASVDPASAARRIDVLAALETALTSINGMANDVQALRQDTNAELSIGVARVNELLTQINTLNDKIRLAQSLGDTSTGHLDQREMAVTELSKFLAIRVNTQPDGRLRISTPSGALLVGDQVARITYAAPATVTTGTSFPAMTIQLVNPNTGATVGPSSAFERHAQDGKLRGLLDLRDRHLADLAEQLGVAAGGLADALNVVHGNGSSVPPPSSLVGSNTGFLPSDALGFSGATTLVVTDAAGVLVRRVDVDFSAGTISANGAGAGTTGATIGAFITNLNAALGGAGTASFVNGVLALQATAAGQGVAIADNATAPSQRGGRSFAQTFGLNDLVRASFPASGNTGLAATDTHGFVAGGQIQLRLRGADGSILADGTYIVAGAQISDIVSGLNSALAGQAIVSLNSSGALVLTAPSGSRLEVARDETVRGSTGRSISQMFSIGSQAVADRARTLSLAPGVSGNPSRLALAQVDISATTAVGAVVLGRSDNRAAQALASIGDRVMAWPSAGGIAAASNSLSGFVAAVTADSARRAKDAELEKGRSTDIEAEVNQRREAEEGVNLDEELSAMIVYQQAYNAAARIMTTVQDMFDTLLSTAGR